MDDLSKEIDKNKENIIEALKRSGTAQIQTSKDGLKVVCIKKQVISRS
jgi:hypothetical protein